MDGWVTIGTELDTKSFDAQIKKLEDDLDTLEQEYEALSKAKPYSGQEEDLIKIRSEIEKTKNSIISLQKQQLKEIPKDIGGIGSSIDSVVKKVGKWALAVFGVRSAYNFIRKAVSSVSQYNEQIGADINYMSMALASTLEPVIRKIVDLAHTLLVYIGYIIKAWTGKDIFKNANKYLQKSVGSAKQLRKELAGFDEMNILGDNSSSGGGSGALPSFDLSKPEDVPIPSWLQWIVDNKDVVIAGLAGIAGGLVAIKLGLDPLQALGIGMALTGIIQLIQDLSHYMDLLDGSLIENGTNWQDFGKILKDVSLVILGVGIATGNLPLAIAGAIGLILGYVVQNWDTIRGKIEEANNWINTKIDDLENKIDGFFARFTQKFPVLSGILRSSLYFILENIRGTADFAKDYIIDTFSKIVRPIKNIIDGILLIFKGDFKNGINNIMKGIGNYIIGTINKLIDGFNSFLTPLRSAIVAIGKVTGQNWSMGTIKVPRIPYLAKGGIVNMPGQGVSLGSAIAGERGREAVLPLQDSQVLSEIADAIGKRITINANITNTMNGRVLSRELQRIQNEESFGFNR